MINFAARALGRVGIIAILVAACATSSHEGYRLDCMQLGDAACRPGDSVFAPPLKITSPNASYDARTRTTTLLVADVVKPQSECTWIEPKQTISLLSVQVRPAGRLGATRPTLFLGWHDDGGEPTSTDAFAARRTQVLTAWNTLLDATSEPWVQLKRCLVPHANDIVRRAIALDWPTGVAESFATRLGFEPGNHGRAVSLRPGMRVCAADAREHADGNQLEPMASAQCADLVNRPGGGTLFHATLGRIRNAFRPPTPESKTVSVSSWEEVIDPDAAMNFVLVNGARMPRSVPLGLLHQSSTLIIGYSPPSPIQAMVAMRCGSARHQHVVEDLCEADRGQYRDATLECVAQVENDPEAGGDKLPSIRPFTCYRFPYRTLVRADFNIFVQGASVAVAVGTTLGDVTDRYASAPSAVDAVALPADKLTAQREGRRLPLGLRLHRRFDDQSALVDLSAVGASARDLPLQPGDVLTW
jgi:hypothetical protein